MTKDYLASTPAQSVLVESIAMPGCGAPFCKHVMAPHPNCHLCTEEMERAPSQPAPVVADDLREAAIRDRAYVLGMKQALREVWPFIRENDRWWDALAKKLKELDARTDTLDKGALRILLDSTSPQPDRESELERVVLRKAKILSQIWTSKGEVDDPDALIAISEVHDAICALYGVDPKVGFALTSSNRPQATEGLVEAIIERAEQACRYALKHQNFEGDETEYQRGWEIAAEVCGGAIRAHVLRHLDEDAPNLEIPKWNSRVVTAALSASVAIMERLLRSPKLWPAQHDEARELLTLLNTHSLTEADNNG